MPVPLPGWRVACRPSPAFPSRVALHFLEGLCSYLFDHSCVSCEFYRWYLPRLSPEDARSRWGSRPRPGGRGGRQIISSCTLLESDSATLAAITPQSHFESLKRWHQYEKPPRKCPFPVFADLERWPAHGLCSASGRPKQRGRTSQARSVMLLDVCGGQRGTGRTFGVPRAVGLMLNLPVFHVFQVFVYNLSQVKRKRRSRVGSSLLWPRFLPVATRLGSLCRPFACGLR